MSNKLIVPAISNDSKTDKYKLTAEEALASHNNLKTLRMKKADLRNYLAKRYNIQIADKIISRFDLSNQWTYKNFVNAMEIVLFQTDEFFFKLAFEALDFNNDGFLSEIDMFLTMKEIKHDIFIQKFVKDFVRIIQFITEKKKLKGTYDEANISFENAMKRVKKHKWTFSDVNQQKKSEDQEPSK